MTTVHNLFKKSSILDFFQTYLTLLHSYCLFHVFILLEVIITLRLYQRRREKDSRTSRHLHSIQVYQEHISESQRSFLFVLVFTENYTTCPSLELSALCPLTHPETSANPRENKYSSCLPGIWHSLCSVLILPPFPSSFPSFPTAELTHCGCIHRKHGRQDELHISIIT